MPFQLLAATRKGLLVWRHSHSGWQFVREDFVGVQVTMVAIDPRTGHWWAGLNHGHWGVKLHRSTDGGHTWNETAAPAMPEGSVTPDGQPATVEYLWCMAAGTTSQPGRLYIGTVPGGLFVSDDNGDSWTLCDQLWNHDSRPGWFGGGFGKPGIHSVLADPDQPDRVAIGVSCAGVLETQDGGSTWQLRNKGLNATFLPDPNTEVGHDPHLLVWSEADRRVMWQQNHCGVFRTTDGGQQWQAVSEAGGVPHFGFAVAADQQDPQVAWVVPAESDEKRVANSRSLAVYRTDDGGATWKRFDQGLPQQLCYDFAFRHGLVHSAGTLALGTASGSLYASGDRGETWQRLASDLAPVYAVLLA